MSMSTSAGIRVLLVRHGRTQLNAEGRLRGQLDPSLDERGLREVVALAHDLRPFEPRAIISSPLLRARQTADAIARRYLLPVSCDERLADRDWGPWAGHLEREVVEQWGAVDAAPGVEPLASVVARSLAVLDEQRHSAWTGAVVLVSHDAVNRSLLACLDSTLATGSGISQRTACWNLLVSDGDGWRVVTTDRKGS